MPPLPAASTQSDILLTPLRGRALLNEPTLNKGTAFTHEERTLLGLHGLLPSRVETLDEQCEAVREKYKRLVGDLERHIFLRALEDTNEVLFYAFLRRDLAGLLPIIYTPTVGEACQQFSHIYRRPHGLFISYPDQSTIAAQLASVEGPVDVIVVTDGERILGIGDQGLGGMGIPIGKLALYTVAGGINPRRSLPVLLDVGTNNDVLLEDPLYLGWRHTRIRGSDYDDFVDDFVQAARQRFPGALIQWEDFAGSNAPRLLERYRSQVPSFNDDIQGTAAVVLAVLQSAAKAAASTLADQRVCIAGAGSAGCGIAGMVAEAMRRAGVVDAESRIVLTDVHGLVHSGRPDLTEGQRPFAIPLSVVAPDPSSPCDLVSVINAIRPTALIGVTGQAELFAEDVIRSMAAASQTPIVLPLSNPTSQAEATPADVLSWTDGRALVATGSPFDDVVHRGVTHAISQANNVYIFPGLGMGAVAVGANAVTDAMLFAAAETLAEASPCSATEGLLPPLSEVRRVSHDIAIAVGKAAIADGVAAISDDSAIDERVESASFEPVYSTFRPQAAIRPERIYEYQ